jgi:hypothetical protein
MKLIGYCILFACAFGCSQPLNSSSRSQEFLHAILAIGRHSNLADYQFSSNRLGINFSPMAPVSMKNWYGANTEISVINYKADGPTNRYPFIFFEKIEYSSHIDPAREIKNNDAVLIFHLACSEFAMNKREVDSVFKKYYTRDTLAIKDSEKFTFDNEGGKLSIVFTYSAQNSCIKQISIFEKNQEEQMGNYLTANYWQRSFLGRA